MPGREGITGGEAYTGNHRERLADVYGVATILTLWLAVLYWWARGLV